MTSGGLNDGKHLTKRYATLKDWYDYGYVQELMSDYLLILPDARGHGASDKPHELEAYTLRKRVEDIVAILDDLNIDRAHYCGYSMGGWVGFGVAKYAPERFQSLIIGGQHPYAQNMEGLREILSVGIENVTLAALPGLDHGDVIRQCDAVVPHIRKFLSTCL